MLFRPAWLPGIGQCEAELEGNPDPQRLKTSWEASAEVWRSGADAGGSFLGLTHGQTISLAPFGWSDVTPFTAPVLMRAGG